MFKKEKDIHPASLKLRRTSSKSELNITNELQTYLHAATSNNTRKAYQQDIRHFIEQGGLLPANASGLLIYLQKFAPTLKPQTLKRRLTAIKHWHTYQGFPDPTAHPLIRKTLSGISRVHGKPAAKAGALTLEQLQKMVGLLAARGQLRDNRDRALLLIGFFGAFRRSELVAIQWQDIQFVEEGMTILIPRSKTDQSREGLTCAIPSGGQGLCAVSALQAWKNASNQQQGPVFRAINKHDHIRANGLTPLSVNHIIKKLALEADLPNPQSYSGHSLRRGFATAASKKGVPMVAIMRQGRWRHEGTVYGYIEEGQRFADNPINTLLSSV